MTYRNLAKLKVVIDMEDRMVIIIKCGFSLKCELVKRVENVEGEGSPRALRCGWKPPNAKKLDITGGCGGIQAVTEVDIDVKNAVGMEHNEVGRANLRARAGMTTVAQLIALAEILEGCCLEESAVPLLENLSVRYRGGEQESYLNSMQGEELMCLEQALATMECTAPKAVQTAILAFNLCTRKALVLPKEIS